MGAQVRESLASLELDAGSDFVLAEWSAPPTIGLDGKPERMAPIHVHQVDDEAWYVLEGALGFWFDGEEFSVPQGGAALAKAGVAHTYWNAAATTTRYLIITTPKIRELVSVLHDAERRAGRSMEEVFAAYDSVLVPDQG
ncbi:MAG: cupin domain-containing protein [Propionibacteriaceae bacterium]